MKERCRELSEHVRRKRAVEECMALYGRSLPMPERLAYRHKLEDWPYWQLVDEVLRLTGPGVAE